EPGFQSQVFVRIGRLVRPSLRKQRSAAPRGSGDSRHQYAPARIAPVYLRTMDIRSVQHPLKDQYRQNPSTSRITLTAHGSEAGAPIACSVDLGRAIYNAQAHQGVGGAGTGACSGDLLLSALAACAQITCQMVAAAMGIETESIEVTVEGDLDLRGTLGISKDVPVGFESVHLHFDVAAPKATSEQLRGLREKTEQYCVVMQTLLRPPTLHTEWVGAE